MGSSDLQALQDFGANTVYLMGGSFVLGSLFTILLLVILDWYRRNGELK